MRTAYLDAFAGISGDMLLGAFVHAGVSVDLLRENLGRLNIGATLQIDDVTRSGLHSKRVLVLEKGEPAGGNGHHHHQRVHSAGSPDHAHSSSGPGSREDGTVVRSLAAIRRLISAASLPTPVEALAIRTFELIGAAEAKVHDVPIELVHFHEVGAVDTIADIVLAATAAHALGIGQWHCSPLNVGGGTIQCAHGRYPVPAPATAELLRGMPTYSSGMEAELVTPTGAALVRALGCAFGPAPLMKIDTIGYGAGTRNPPGFANVLRLSVGETQDHLSTSESVLVMEVAIDDLNPQIISYVTEQGFKLGALDVMCTAVGMKKNRPGVLLTILSDRDHAAVLQDLLLRETSTLGLRIHEENRVCLQRKHVSVATEWGPVRVKVGHRDGQEFNTAPEFDDCRRIAEDRRVPVKRVIESALQAYRENHP
jgi:uncharacterized protein (TIGR00299 family) protein